MCLSEKKAYIVEKEENDFYQTKVGPFSFGRFIYVIVYGRTKYVYL